MSPRRTNVMLLSHNNKKVRYNVAVGKMQRINGINTVNLRKEQKIKKRYNKHENCEPIDIDDPIDIAKCIRKIYNENTIEWKSYAIEFK